MNIAPFGRHKLVDRLLILAIACQTLALRAATDPRPLVDEGQRSFEIGNFSQAAASWQNAVDLFRQKGDTNSEISTLVSLASACQSLGQQRHAIDLLERGLDSAKSGHDQALVTLVKS